MQKYVLYVFMLLVLLGLACNLSGVETEVGVETRPPAGDDIPTNPTPTLAPTQIADTTENPTVVPTDIVPTPVPQEDPTPVPTDVPVAPAGANIIRQLGGSILALAVRDDIAYVSVGSRFATIDISDTRNPQWLSQTDPFPELLTDIALHGDTAYAIVEELGLAIFDVSDPASPVLQSHTTSFDGYADFTDLVVLGNTVYLLTSHNRLDEVDRTVVAVDVSNPAGATYISHHTLTESAHSLAQTGHTLYALYDTGVTVLDIADPTNIQSIGSILKSTGSGYLSSFVIVDGLAYAASTDGLAVYEVNSPTELTLLASAMPEEFFPSHRIVVDGNIVHTFFTFGEFGYCETTITTYDFADFDNPTAQEPVRVPSCSNKMVAQDFHLFANGWQGLSIFRLDNGVPLAQSTLVDSSGLESAGFLALDGERLYVATGDGTAVLDSSVPSHPTFIGKLPLNVGAVGIFQVQDGLLYASSLGAGIRIFDVSDYQNPYELIHLEDAFGMLGEVVLVNNHVYLTDGELKGWDVTDAASPHRTLTVVFEEPYAKFLLGGTAEYLFVAQDWNREYSLDILTHGGDLVQSLPLSSRASSAIMNGSHIYVTSGDCYDGECDNYLTIIDVSDMANPTSTELTTPLSIADIVVRGNYVYVTASDMGIMVVDVTDPMHPVIHQQIDLPSYTGFIYEVGDLLYVPAGRGGLYIIEPIE